MHRNVFGLGTLDLVLRIIFAGAMSVALVINILCMNLMIVPLTWPASEFQVTRSPTLNRFAIMDLRTAGSPEAATDMAALLRG